MMAAQIGGDCVDYPPKLDSDNSEDAADAIIAEWMNLAAVLDFVMPQGQTCFGACFPCHF
jgi:hypothetical protein